MDFYDTVRQVLEFLQRDGRTTYRALKRQFGLDDETLEDLKQELLFAHPVVDDEGRGLVWTGDPASPEPDTQCGVDNESRFHALLPEVIAFLQRNMRVTYHRLQHIFGIDDALLENLLKEFTFQQIARDEKGEGLVWTGEPQPEAELTRTIANPEVVAVPFTKELDRGYDQSIVPAESTRSTPDAERRQLTVMFCDLADSTKLSQQLDPEDLREVVRAYQSTAAEAIQPYDGHMAQYLGDGLLIYFGWPQAHEDDAQRAAHAGLAIVEAITNGLNPHLRRQYGVTLTVRLGIHTGLVVIGEMGGGGLHENLATGDTVNIAARLESLAAANEVLISNVTARLIERSFRLQDMGLHELKGVTDPMPVFSVIAPREEQQEEDDMAAIEVPFLVGRDEEMGLLLRRWEQSKEGLGQAVLISGEAGIGKSSLVATVRQHVQREGYTRITMHGSPYHTNSALYPVIEHVQRVLDLQPDDSPQEKLAKLEAGLQAYSRPLPETVPLFAALLSVPLPEERYTSQRLTPQQQRQQTQDALVGWMLEVGEQQPVLALWEDLHWADPSTLELLGLVLEQTPTVPMLHVLTFRPEFEPSWPNRSHLTPITLNRLERPQVEALIMHLAAGKTLPFEVVQHIVAKTDGVPLYVEELTKMILESDLLVDKGDQYVLTGPLLTVAIPDTLQDSLMARLDQLNTAKEVAQLGAVLGREFSYDMLRAISSQDDEILQSSLSQLVEAELLYQRGRVPRATYIFKHALIQDAAYASLLKSTRQRMHARIARQLEERFPDLVETQPELIAHHYNEGAQSEQAVVYWQQAGKRNVGNSAHAEALAHFGKALKALEMLPLSRPRLQRELDLQLDLGAPLLATKGYAAVERRQAYSRAWELSQQLGQTSQRFAALFGLWQANLIGNDLQTARDQGEQLLAIAMDQDDPDLLLEAHRALACTLTFRGELIQGREHAERGVALYDPHRHQDNPFVYGQDSGMSCHLYLAWALLLLGFPDQALHNVDQAVSVARNQSHPFSVAMAQAVKTMIHQCRSEIQDTLTQAEAVCTLCMEQNFAFYLAWGNTLHGWALAAQGKAQAGLQQMHEGLSAYRATGARWAQPYLLALQAEAFGCAGQPEQGLSAVTESLRMIEKTSEAWWQAEIYRLRGSLLLLESPGDSAEAETCFQQAISVAQSQQAKSWELRAATSLARLWQSQGKSQEAYDLLSPVYGWFTEGFDTADLKDARALLDDLT